MTANKTNKTANFLGYKRKAESLSIVYSHVSEDFSFDFLSTADNMRGFIIIRNISPTYTLSPVFLKECLSNAGITHGINVNSLHFFSNLQNKGTPFLGPFQIAYGTSIKRGDNGLIEFHVLPTAASPRYESSDKGSIDYKQLNLVESCFSGQLIATIHPPSQGKPGLDIFSNIIPPESGTPALLEPGDGVKVASNGRDFLAETDGRVVFENHILSVSSNLVINSNIDYSVGHIDFIGKVIIKGSVLDGFSIKGKKGIEISGDFGAAEAISEGDVVISGGIKGRSSGFIRCKSLHSRYIDGITVESFGDVVASKEILHANIKSLGMVSISKGSIIGGEILSFKGIEADSIGSELGVTTKLTSGLDWTDADKISLVMEKITDYNERIQIAKMILSPFISDKSLTPKLTVEHKIIISDILTELRRLKSELESFIHDKSLIENREQTDRVCQINVKNFLYFGTQVAFTKSSLDIKDTLKGPLSLIQDESKSLAKNVSLRPFPNQNS